MKRTIITLQLLVIFCLSVNSFAQGGKVIARPVVKLGKNEGNHLDGEKIIKPVVRLSDILADPRLIPDSPGCKILDYKFSLLTSDNKYWGPFLREGFTLDEVIINRIKDEEFIKGRIFIEDIHVRYKGFELVAPNLILEYNR